MRLTLELLKTLPAEDAQLLHFVDTAFFPRRPEKIAVAVSGGGDSMALLYAFACHSQMTGAQVEAVSVDHGLRPEARQEIALAEELCSRFQITHIVVTWDGWDGTGNLQAEARGAQ